MQSLNGLTDSTTFRWTLAIAAGFTMMALILFGFIYWQTAVYEQEKIDSIIIAGAKSISSGPSAETDIRLKLWLANDPHGLRYGAVFGRYGNHLAGNFLNSPKHLPTGWTAHRAVFKGIDRDDDGDDPEVVRATSIRLPEDRTLVLGYDIDELDEVENIVLRALSLGLLPMLLLSILSGTILAVRAHRRIASVHAAIGQVRSGQLSGRLPVRGTGDDLDRLADAVNGMLREIEQLFYDIRGVSDSIAHDLRTPLSRVRNRLERSREEAQTIEEFQGSIDKAIVHVDQTLAVISSILRISAIDHGRRQTGFAPVQLAKVLKDAVELYEPLAEEKNVSIKLVLEHTDPVTGDQDLLLEAIGNLLDNAIKFTPSGTEVMLSMENSQAGIRIRISDQGPGVKLEEREQVFKRFYRSERSRSVTGSGLGLSLVASIMTLHGFHIRIEGVTAGCLVEILCPTGCTSNSTKAIE